MKEKVNEKHKAHQRYKLLDGTLVPGVTTILDILSKPALIHWAWDLGMKGLDYRKVKDTAASIGTICHYMVECHIKNEKPDLSIYPQDDILKAENSFLGYLEWEKQNNFELIFSEKQLVSERERYGGTADIYAKLNNKKTLIDVKTSKGLYPEYRIQVADYEQLLLENGFLVEDVILLKLDKETGEFSCHPIKINKEYLFFCKLKDIYNLKKQLNGGD
jgi:hypothetical protein